MSKCWSESLTENSDRITYVNVKGFLQNLGGRLALREDLRDMIAEKVHSRWSCLDIINENTIVSGSNNEQKFTPNIWDADGAHRLRELRRRCLPDLRTETRRRNRARQPKDASGRFRKGEGRGILRGER